MSTARPTAAALLALAALVVPAGPARAQEGGSPDRPNILMVVLDDLGYGDWSAFGGEGPSTPTLDRLAVEGVRFTRHYAASICAPARASIMTGCNPSRVGYSSAARGLSPDLVTLPELLRGAGYRTQHVGKWHLGETTPVTGPMQQGFDGFYGFLDAKYLGIPLPSGELKARRPSYLNPRLIEGSGEPKLVRGHLTRILGERAIDTLESLCEDRTSPWFLQYWTFAPHLPSEPLETYASFFPDDEQGAHWALVRQLDDQLGLLLEALERSGQRENTVVLVLSDNGARLARSNQPFHGEKESLLEGGLRTPFVARWPGRWPAAASIDAPVTTADLLPTLAAVVGVEPPAGIDGIDLAPILAGEAAPERPLFWEYVATGTYSYSVLSADGRWRLTQPLGELQAARLFDLTDDPSGATDVAAEQPAVVAELTGQYRVWHDEVNELPLELEPLAENGRGRLSGRDLLRSPGLGGFTFGIEVNAEAPEAGPQVLARQEGLWSLVHEPGRGLVARVEGLEGAVELEGPALVAGRATKVTFTGFFRRSNKDKVPPTTLALFVDGERVAARVVHVTVEDLHLDRPTWIGVDADGERVFRGHLGRPLVTSDGIGAEDSARRPGIARFEARLGG